MDKAAKIEIMPLKFDGLMTTAVNITCLPLNVKNGIKKVVGITLVRGEQSMASLLQGSEVAYGNDLMTTVQAEGLIDSKVSKSFLRVTMPHVLIRDSGKYTCNIYHVNEVGFLDVETTWDNLVVDDQDIQIHLAFLIKKIFIQDDLIKDQAQQLEDQSTQLEDLNRLFKTEGSSTMGRIVGLQDITRNQTREINALRTNGTYMSVFSATLDAGYDIKEGHVFVFENVLTKTGKGYDEKTGLFTAPMSGIYAFHISLCLSYSGGYLRVTIQVEGNVVTRSFIGHRNYRDQSAMSCVVALNTGDVVGVVAEFIYDTSSLSMCSEENTNVFTGYLIKTL